MSCPACLSSETAPYRLVKGFPLWRCRSCGLLFRYPVPSEQELASIYAKSYYESWGGEDMEELAWKQKQAYFKGHLLNIRRRVDAGKLLDIGCAKGSFVGLALAGGFDAYGVEISAYAAAAAGSAVGKDRIICGTVESAPFEAGSFDVVTMFDFIEHVSNLDMTFLAVSRLLKPGGIIYVVTPDAASLSLRLMRGQWWHFKAEHIHYFQDKSLGRLMERFGFRPLSAGKARKTLSLAYIDKQLRSYPVSLVSPLFRMAFALLPRAQQRRFITVPSGEFIAVARRESF